MYSLDENLNTVNEMERGGSISAPSLTKVGQNWEKEEAERSTAASKVKDEAGRGGTQVVIKGTQRRRRMKCSSASSAT
jgi:hypothetical protein